MTMLEPQKVFFKKSGLGFTKRKYIYIFFRNEGTYMMPPFFALIVTRKDMMTSLSLKEAYI